MKALSVRQPWAWAIIYALKDVCNNFDNTYKKPTLPDNALIAVVLFAGGGGIEAGMVQAGIHLVIAVEFDPTKPELSRAIPSAHFVNAKTHHHNFSEYGCRIIQLTIETADDLSAANRQVGASLSQLQKPSDSCSHGCSLSKMFHAIRIVRVSVLFCQLWNKRGTRLITAWSTWLILDCPRRVGG